MTKYVLALIVFLIIGTVYAQTWSRIIDIDGNDLALDGIPFGDDFALTGYSFRMAPLDSTKPFLLILDAHGNTKFELPRIDTLNGEGLSIIKSHYGNLIIALTEYVEFLRWRPVVIEISPNGEVIWQSHLDFGPDEWGTAADVILLEDGYLFVGSKAPDYQQQYYRDTYVVKLDKDGNVIWTIEIGDEDLSEDGVVASVSENKTLAVCSSVPYSSEITSTRGVVIYLLDELGNVLNSISHGDSIHNYAPRTLHITENEVTLSGARDPSLASSFMVKFNHEGQQIWLVEPHLDVGLPRLSGCTFAPLPNGEFMFVGSRFSDEVFIKYNALGQVIWQHRLDSVIRIASVHQIYQLADNGFFMTGWSLDGKTQDIRCLRVDSLGEVSTSLGHIRSLSNAKVYPNPTADSFTIDLVDNQTFSGILTIHSVGGKLIKRVEAPNSKVTVDVSDVQPGVYFWNLMDRHGQTLGFGKIVVE